MQLTDRKDSVLLAFSSANLINLNSHLPHVHSNFSTCNARFQSFFFFRECYGVQRIEKPTQVGDPSQLGVDDVFAIRKGSLVVSAGVLILLSSPQKVTRCSKSGETVAHSLITISPAGNGRGRKSAEGRCRGQGERQEADLGGRGSRAQGNLRARRQGEF